MSHIEVEHRAAVTHIKMIGSPDRGNPLSEEMVAALLGAMDAAEADDAVKAMVLSGTERHFCVGADLRDIDTREAIAAVLGNWLEGHDKLTRRQKPVIAAVRGHAVGGGFELALGCDMIVAAEDARFSLPETGIGVIPGQQGTQRIIALAGRAIATDLALTGRVLSGIEARETGIAARAVPADAVVPTALEIGAAIAERSAPSIRFAREILWSASEGHLAQTFRTERLLASLVLDTAEKKERVGAFLAARRK
ncbi:enoyl-CoA hydratase-related protein [Acuticoccus sp. M5D2P5]|uniref:enoyl-CoA hydratase/isomerase family protein n=1 Tax=Acuticoccus kalidii TaxID=2910977 RepID=UPI001F1FF4D9|nr:enoyl-CoA hydratase-related protein [Acuticoccus kalidii]MCF3936108.1 enoyl-CoA hydratase-related protein [Acuticoccus kalidii]